MQKLVKYVWFDISFCRIYYILEKLILEWRSIYFQCFNTIAQCQWNLNLRKGVYHAKNCSFDRIRNLPVNHCNNRNYDFKPFRNFPEKQHIRPNKNSDSCLKPACQKLVVPG